MPRPERPVDPEAGVVQRFAVELRKLREEAGSPGYRELARRAHYSATTLAQAARGDRLPSLAVTLAYVRACGGDVAGWEARWRAAADASDPAFRDGAADDQLDGRPPYAGLAAFGPDDGDRFFGRDRLIDRLVVRLAQRRMVVVSGASGSGKSSVLRAGLLPALRAADGSCRTLLITPGSHPLEECAVRIGAELGLSPGQLVAEFAEQPRNLGLTIRQILAKHSADADFILVVDQFEEVFTLCADAAERNRFIAALLAAATDPDSHVRVVLGLRADFLGHCARHPQLVEVLEDAQILIGPMTTDELRQAITQPAIQIGCAVETALVARLIADATDQPSVLPLLSHALLETWRRRRGNTLTLAGYEATGGIHRAVARSAEHAYTALDPGRQQLARQLFLRLTAPGEGTEDTKRRIARGELDTDDPDITVVLEHLAAARLITLDQGSVEVAHESLIRSWPRLRDWIADDRDGLRVHRQLTDATEAWESLDRDPGTLYRGTRLAIAKDWADDHEAALTQREREFLQASLSAQAREHAADHRRTRRLRQLVGLLTALLIVAATTTVYARWAQRTAAEQRTVAVAHKVIGEATALRLSNPALAAQLGLAAYRLAPTIEAHSGLLSTFATPYAIRLTGHSDGVYAVSFSHDGHLLATASDDHTVKLWDVTNPHRPKELATLSGHGERVRSVAFSSDGRRLATASDDSTARLWDVTDPGSPRELAILTGFGSAVTSLAFHPDGRILATASADKTGRLWDITDPRHPRPVATLAGHTGAVTSVAFRPDGAILATGSWDSTARLWHVDDPGQPAAILRGHTDRVTSVTFSTDGRHLATAGHDRTARLWDVTDPAGARELSTLTGHTNSVYAAAFHPDGATLATASSDSTVRLWTIADPTHAATVDVRSGHTNSVYAAAFHPDGRTLATASLDSTVRLEDLPGPTVIDHRDIVWSAGFSPDGRILSTASSDRTARLWDLTDPRHRQLTTLAGHTAPVASVAFSPDGRTVITASWDGVIRLWDRTNPQSPTKIAGHTGSVFTVALSPNGRTLATAGDDHTARLWDLTDPQQPMPVATLTGHTKAVYAAAFGLDARILATASEDHTVRLWDLTDPRNPTAMATISGHTNVVWSVAFSQDGRTLATAAEDRTVRLWDLTNPRNPNEVAILSGHTATVHSVTFSADGRTLASAGDDHAIRLWDLTDRRNPKAKAVLSGHTDAVYSVAFSPDGHTLATASKDQTTRLWETDVERVAAQICGSAHPTITPSEWSQHFPDIAYQPPCPR